MYAIATNAPCSLSRKRLRQMRGFILLLNLILMNKYDRGLHSKKKCAGVNNMQKTCWSIGET